MALKGLEIKRRLSKPQFDAAFQRQPKKWDAVVRMLVGLVDDADALIRSVAAVDPFLALQCAFSNAEVTNATYEAVISPLIQPQSAADKRVAAANVLIDYDPALAHSLLLDAARAADWNVRQAAAQALRQLDFSAQAAASAADQADLATADQAVGVWLHFLHTPQRQLQQEAARALGDLKDRAAVPFLVEVMQSADRAAASEAIAALGCIGDEAAIPHLVGTLAHADWRLSKTAAESLARMGDGAFVALREVVEGGAESRRQRIHAVEILAQMGRADANKLVLAFTFSTDVEERYAAVAALQHLDGETALPRLIECLDDIDQPDWSMQRICDIAANILENMGSREASTAVKKWRLSQLKNIRIGKRLTSDAADSTPARDTGKTVKDRLLRAPEPDSPPKPRRPLFRPVPVNSTGQNGATQRSP